MNFSQLGFGVFSLKIYGIFFAFIFLYVVWRYYRNIQKQKLPIDFFVHHFWRWILAGVLGARLIGVLFDPRLFMEYGFGGFLVFWEGDFSPWGFVVGFLYFLWRDARNEQFSLWRWLDPMVLPLVIGLMFDDVASFLTGKSYGALTSLPWGVQYETFSVETIDPVHPVTLYALIFHGILFYLLRKNRARYSRLPGIFFQKTLIFLLIGEFWFSFLRGDRADLWSIFKIDHLLILVLLSSFMVYLHKNKNLVKILTLK